MEFTGGHRVSCDLLAQLAQAPFNSLHSFSVPLLFPTVLLSFQHSPSSTISMFLLPVPSELPTGIFEF